MFFTITRQLLERCVILAPLGVSANQACSAKNHGTYGFDKTGPPPGVDLNRESSEDESSGGCC